MVNQCKNKVSETKSETESTSDIIIEPDCETESEIELNEKENESETQSTRVQEPSKKDGRDRDEPQINVMKERDLSPAANPPNAFIPQSAPCPMRPPQQVMD